MRTEDSVPGVHIEVGVRQLREELKAWLARAQAGDEITVTDRGRRVARLVPPSAPYGLDRLIAEGTVRITPARAPRRRRTLEDLIPTKGPVSDFVKDQRR